MSMDWVNKYTGKCDMILLMVSISNNVVLCLQWWILSKDFLISKWYKVNWDQAEIARIWIDKNYRWKWIAPVLYTEFGTVCIAYNREKTHNIEKFTAISDKDNTSSVKFHIKMWYQVQPDYKIPKNFILFEKSL